MYWRRFNLTAEPFSLTPDPAFLFLSAVHAEAFAALTMGLKERRGLVTMIGEVGTGKTTLVYSLLSNLGPDINTAYISNARLSFDGMVRSALRDFGVETNAAPGAELLTVFNEFLHRCAQDNTTAALVIDEAQNLSNETFEDLRLLSNFETYKHKLLQIVMVGQPELDTKLRDPSLRQVAERVAVRCNVNPLTAAESRQYIEHRLASVNGSTKIFSEPALRLLIKRSRGIPRTINILCHNALLFAYGQGKDRVTRPMVAEAIAEKEGRGLVRLRAPLAGWLPRAERSVEPAPATSSLPRGLTLAGVAVTAALAGMLIARSGPGLRTEPPAAVAPSHVAAARTHASPAAGPTPRAERQRAAERRRQSARAAERAGAVQLPVSAAIAAPPSAPTPPAPAAAPAPPAPAPAREPVLAAVPATSSPVDPPAAAPAPQLAARPAAKVQLPGIDTGSQPAAQIQDRRAARVAAARTAPQQAAPLPVESTTSRREIPPTALMIDPAAPPTDPRRMRVPGSTPDPAAVTAANTRGGRIVDAAPAAAIGTAGVQPTPAPSSTSALRQRGERAATRVARTASVARVQALTVPQANDTLQVEVKQGNSLTDLMVSLYGRYNTSLIREVQTLNPQVTDPNLILTGDTLRFPAPAPAGTADGEQDR